MATNTSEYLGLHLWEPDDQVLREEFNENWEKIDGETAELRTNLTAVNANLGTGGKTCRIASGSYGGTGTYGESNPTVFSCQFTPVALVVYLYDASQILRVIRGMSTMNIMSNGIPHTLNIIWDDHSVSLVSDDARAQFNQNIYHYVVIGHSAE